MLMPMGHEDVHDVTRKEGLFRPAMGCQFVMPHSMNLPCDVYLGNHVVLAHLIQLVHIMLGFAGHAMSSPSKEG